MRDAKDDFVLVDVRNPDEFEISVIDGSVHDPDVSMKMAAGSGPAEAQAAMERKRQPARPSLRTILSAEMDGDSELDVPTFIRRHSTHT